MGIAKLTKNSILAGLAISIGCIAYLVTGYAWLFPIGLFIVCAYGLYLFTGKICYATIIQIPKLAYVWFMNTITAYGFGTIMKFVHPDIIEKASTLCVNKLSTLPMQLVIKAILCNIMIFVAVDVFKKYQGTMFGFVGLLFATTIFVVCGFEHCIANAFYFGLGTEFSINNIIMNLEFLIINTVFNAVGGVCIYRLIGTN